MKVSGYKPTDLPASKTSANNTPKASSDALQAAASPSAEASAVVLSGASSAAGKGGLSQFAEVDTQKVAAMKAAIANRTFVVNPQAIADKMISGTQEMFTSKAN